MDTAEQAVEVTNRIQYGLTSSILADDTYKAFELAPKILHGIVNVNSSTVTDEIHAPMGGVRSSGWRRTGPECLADFSDIIWINTTSAERQFPVQLSTYRRRNVAELRAAGLTACYRGLAQ